LDFWDDLSPLTKASSAFFVLGKATGFMTFIMYFVDLVLAKWMLMLYASFIGISILLSCIQMFRTKKADTKPSLEQVQAWAREYNLLEGK
jgi:hypothetical protein